MYVSVKHVDIHVNRVAQKKKKPDRPCDLDETKLTDATRYGIGVRV